MGQHPPGLLPFIPLSRGHIPSFVRRLEAEYVIVHHLNPLPRGLLYSYRRDRVGLVASSQFELLRRAVRSFSDSLFRRWRSKSGGGETLPSRQETPATTFTKPLANGPSRPNTMRNYIIALKRRICYFGFWRGIRALLKLSIHIVVLLLMVCTVINQIVIAPRINPSKLSAYEFQFNFNEFKYVLF